jgi:hypothetical protein
MLIVIGEVRGVNRLAQRAKLLGPAISPLDPFAARVIGHRPLHDPLYGQSRVAAIGQLMQSSLRVAHRLQYRGDAIVWWRVPRLSEAWGFPPPVPKSLVDTPHTQVAKRSRLFLRVPYQCSAVRLRYSGACKSLPPPRQLPGDRRARRVRSLHG